MTDRIFWSRRELLVGAAAAAALAAVSGGREAAAQSLPVPLPMPTPRPLPVFVPHTIAVRDAGSTLQRTFLAHIPQSIGQVPAVIVFHGGGQDATAMVQHWEALIADTNFAIICPNALIEPLENKTRWQFARPGDVAVPTTDLAFVDALLDWLQATGKIDMDRIYATGFSSGAGMTWQLTQLNAFVNRIRGFAPVSHRLNSAQLQLSEAAARTMPKPVAFTMGTAEPNWGGLDDSGGSEPTPTDNVRYWMQRNHTLAADAPVLYRCNLEQPVDVFGVEQLYRPDPQVAGSQALLWMTTVNGGHCWPLTGHDPSGRGLVNRDVNWTKRVVAFWNTYAGMSLPSVPDWRLC